MYMLTMNNNWEYQYICLVVTSNSVNEYIGVKFITRVSPHIQILSCLLLATTSLCEKIVDKYNSFRHIHGNSDILYSLKFLIYVFKNKRKTNLVPVEYEIELWKLVFFYWQYVFANSYFILFCKKRKILVGTINSTFIISWWQIF